MNWNEAKPLLSAKLDPAHVKTRSQAGQTLSYIEGWHAIAEMNRIFGFGGWTRETLELRQLGEPREVNGKMRVDYMARVRITVWGVIRDGCGFGQGIDKDVGQAHESALKEAETDAMKRAMMTLGNPFGLALYDKSRENVGVDTPPFDPRAAADRIIARINRARDFGELREIWSDEQETIALVKSAAPAMEREIVTAKDKRKAAVDPALQGPALEGEAA